MTDCCDKDLEKYGQGFEEEKVELPEDRPWGKLKYFTSLWIITCTCIIQSILAVPLLLFGPLAWFTVYRDVSRISTIVLVFLGHYCVFVLLYAVSWSISYDDALNKKTLGIWLEEVENANLGDPEAWRRIAFKVNQTKRFYDPFYSGKQCRRFFVRQVVERVESNTYNVPYRPRVLVDAEYFCYNSSNKLLVQRAVNNFKKSAQYSETDKKEEEMKRIEASDASMGPVVLSVLISVVEFLAFLSITILRSLIGALRG